MVEESAVTPRHAPHPDPLAPYTLDALLEGAAQMRPDAAALVDDFSQSLTFAALAEEVETLAAHLIHIGLLPDDTVIVLGSAQSRIVAALLAGARAQIHVALAPVNIRAEQLTMLALRLNASAILCADAYNGFAPVDTAFAAAALAAGVRVVATLGAEAHDGAVDLAPQALSRLAASPGRRRLPASSHCSARMACSGRMARIIRFSTSSARSWLAASI